MPLGYPGCKKVTGFEKITNLQIHDLLRMRHRKRCQTSRCRPGV